MWTSIEQPEDILVIGAGPAGLATSACLRRAGLAHVVLEREGQIADTWHRHYDRLCLHTTKTYSALPFTSWPKTAPRYPPREQLVRYLQAYAKEHHVTPRLGAVRAEAARRTGSSALWLTANSRNKRAQAFYARRGFTEIGVSDFDLYGEQHENRILHCLDT